MVRTFIKRNLIKLLIFIQGWRIEALGETTNAEMPPMPPPPAFDPAEDTADGPDDDLPF